MSRPLDLDGLCRDIMAMNAAAALAYRDMPMPNRPITDDDEVPGGEDQGESCIAPKTDTGD